MNDDHDALARESRLRSILKAITYRITGTITTCILVFVVTGEFEMALAVGAIEPLVKILVYYAHERLWAMVPHGTFRRFVTSIRS